ncbi:hypothetical protein [Mesobacillus zeae]|uniref:Uncharacterized protein n=1 Tax=Mesobacillus zeae TaxID=1917180 RepID=A0A398B6Y3_9BACI|nr:hypothetical protein [Mesobacillus zeae]RID85879.1 hypothetical protein D1970_10170 [Mesobacillus zeae]
MHINDGGSGTKIVYDSGRTMDAVQQIENALSSYKNSSAKVRAEFDRVFAELSGEAIEQYQTTVQDYMRGTQLTEHYISLLISLVKTADDLLAEAESRSRKSFDSISI